MTKIDPSARVADAAKIGANVEIGPYCIIGPDVTIGDGCQLIAHVNIAGVTTIGPRTLIYPFASLGTPPQSVHYKGEPSRLLIGADCVIRESVTMNTGTAGGRMETRVGERCMFMAYAHVGHDCIVGNNVIFANGGTLGGHCTVGDFVFMGGYAAVHQFVRIGERAVIGGLSGVVHDVIPFAAANGQRAKLAGLNIVGLKRGGLSRPQIHALRHAYRMLFAGPGTVLESAEKVAGEFPGDENVQRIVQFVREAGKRRLTTPRASSAGDDD
ncbi:MAG TPA: acyl-ACP--UDP-N-acetylglucosamine O-acyltransferase [Xanthobacteraceae bacterium]|nr:acyl-ACP--UDP-N-acetylglucosamine O-acyltransferase [Xanthobacteraceae bacterium]